jgi:NAD(P) transhydrogenase subunit alpha
MRRQGLRPGAPIGIVRPPMKLGIPTEIRAGERRVAASPTTVGKWVKAGWEVVVQAGAGAGASFADALYTEAGATIAPDAGALWSGVDIVLKLHAPEAGEAAAAKAGTTLISFIRPAQNEGLVDELAGKGLTVLAMDCVPRISRAQKMDALSSMANIAGYRAVIEAANHYGSFFTGQITAAGKVKPAKVLIIGCGVAGLASLGAAKGLGAIVRAFDVRPSVEDQIKSLGGEFLTVSIKESGEGQGGYAKEMSKEFIDAEMALFRDQAKDVDIVITTALIPGKPAPKLWMEEAVKLMKPGSVVVDLAAEQGGNCELTVPGEVVVRHGVTIIGHRDLAQRLPGVASELYGTNLAHFLDEMGGAKDFKIDHGNDAVRPALVLERGEKRWPAPPMPAKVAPPPVAAPAPAPVAAKPAPKKSGGHGHAPAVDPPSRTAGIVMAVIGLIAAAVWLGLRFGKPEMIVSPTTEKLLSQITVFIMAIFVGWQVVWNVAPALHTPLMSVTNAISGIIVVGGLLGGSSGHLGAAELVAVAATLFATINIAGGFLVTRRMLAMFRK